MRKSALMLSPLVAVLALSAACILFPDPGDDEGWRRIPEGDGTAPRERERSPPHGRRAGPSSGRR